MGNKIKTLLLIFVFCIFAGAVPRIALADSTAVECNELISQRDVDTKKSWTIKFNKEVNVNTINTNTIKVVDDNNKLIDINIQIAQDRKSVTITPKTDYLQGNNYYVIISKDVQADSKSVMQKDVKMKFTTKNPFKACLDAGDGGLDTGVVGQGGAKEKDINLSIALKAGKILESNGVQVSYTRKDDNITWAKGDLVPRFKIANDAKADYFVSIHCNSSNDNPLATGIESYYASDSQKGQSLAVSLDTELASKTGLKDRGAKEGTALELTGTSAVGIKVYVGFLTSADEEKRLITEDFQNKCAEAIASAILKNKINNSASVLTIKEDKKDNYIAHYDEIVNKVYVGQRVNLPQALSVNMSDGTTSKFAVKWENNNPDTSKPGTYLLKGKLDGFTQDITATLVVLPWIRPKTAIAIDAGHGGYDSGAIGPSGVVENEVTLSVAQKLGKILESKGIGVVYTRTDNNIPKPNGGTYGEYVSRDLQRRCDVSDIVKANYFVSIHCNANNLNTINGTQTFFCGGSTEGKNLADSIQSELIKALNTNDRGTTSNDYYVLKYTKAPAVLTELAFLSNPDEEKLLKTEDFQLKCANAIAEGIVKVLQSQ